MYGEVNHHAPAHKVLQQKLPCKIDVFFKRKLILQGNVKAVCKLGVLSTLGFFPRRSIASGGLLMYIGRGQTSRKLIRQVIDLQDGNHPLYAIITGETNIKNVISGDYNR